MNATVAKAIGERSLPRMERTPATEAKPNLRKSEIRTTRPRIGRDLEAWREVGQLLRGAIRRAGLSFSEASGLLDVKDESQFRRMLDGIEPFGVHRLLTDKAAPIWDEVVALRAKRSGHIVRRVIEIKEA